MTASNIIRFPAPAVRALPDNSLRGDCERLMRRLVKDGRTPEEEMRILANVLDHIITRVERTERDRG